MQGNNDHQAQPTTTTIGSYQISQLIKSARGLHQISQLLNIFVFSFSLWTWRNMSQWTPNSLLTKDKRKGYNMISNL